MSIFRRADRREEGVAPDTAAAMRVKNPPSRSDHPPLKKEEVWIMYQTKPGKKVTMISAWRYPGTTKPGAPIPIPQDILTELTQAGTL